MKIFFVSEPSEILVREHDSRNFKSISVEEYRAAEDRAGKTSAFAETRSVYDGKVDNGMTVQQFINYRNSNS